MSLLLGVRWLGAEVIPASVLLDFQLALLLFLLLALLPIGSRSRPLSAPAIHHQTIFKLGGLTNRAT